MKRILPFFVIVLLAGSSSGQLNVWRWQNPLPAGNYLRAVQMISLTTIYTCGDEGCFIRSSDGGASWDIQSNVLKFKGSFTALSFLDQHYGMCCGDSGRVIKTTDGGATWQILATNIKLKLNSIVVIDMNIAVMVATGGAIMRTTDGGNSWVVLPIEGNYDLYNIRMLRPDFLTATGYAGTVRRSTDKGLTWTSIPTHIGNSFFNSDFTDNSNGTIIGEYGAILHTTDGGSSWKQQQIADSTNPVTSTLNVVDGKDPNTLAIVGDYGTLLHTSDGGATWLRSYIGTAEPIKGLSFFDKLTAIAVGRNGLILKTTDGGANWIFLPHKAFNEVLHGVASPKGDTSHCIAVGNAGTILRTSDGGKTWTQSESGFNGILYGVSFMDTAQVIAVGEFGTILKSTDAGLSWVQKTSGVNLELDGVSFSTPTTGIIVGDSGTILRTYSSGEFWGHVYTSPVAVTNFFTGVSFPDSLHAFISGEFAIYKTTDGGLTWLRAPGDSSRGQAISFGDSLHGGFVFADKWTVGYTRCTSNGGITFDSVYPGTKNTLFNICFSDRQHATVVGAFGYIAHSTDGGRSWVEQTSNTVNNLYGICFGTIKAGTAVGNRGNIMRITSDDKLAVHDHSASGSPKPILDPCYPNPAATSAAISYYLPSGGFASIKMYTIDGKEIATLANGFMQQGDQKTRCDVSHLASGSYLIRLDFGGVSVSQRLTVMR